MENFWQNEYGMEVLTLSASSDIETLTQSFQKISEEQRWQSGDQIQAYRTHSAYFAIKAHGQIIGGLHLVLGRGAQTLPCLTVWPELAYAGRTDVADIALLAILRPFRGAQRLFWPLCVEMWRYCRAEGITTLIAEVTPANLRLYRRLGWTLHIIGPLRPHWGEDCYPCTMDVGELADAVQAKSRTSPRYRCFWDQAFRGNSLPEALCLSSPGTP